MTPQMQRAPGHGVEIQLAHWPGRGRSVFCVHGLTANCRAWDVIAGELSPEHDVWALDLRGRGRSDKPETGYGIAAHCADILAVADHLGVERFAVMGHSLGAYIALALAAQNPQRVQRAVLVDGGAQLSEAEMAKVFAWVSMSVARLNMVMPDFEQYRAVVQQAPFLQPWNPALDDYLAYEIQEVEGGVRSSVSPAAVERDAEDLRQAQPAELYRRVACPVLILRAPEAILGDDLILPQAAVDKMLREIKDATLVNLAGANHYNIINADMPQRRQALTDFLAP